MIPKAKVCSKCKQNLKSSLKDLANLAEDYILKIDENQNSR